MVLDITLDRATIANCLWALAIATSCGCASVPPAHDALPNEPVAAFDAEFPKLRDRLQGELDRRPRTKFVAFTMEPNVGAYVEQCLRRILAVSKAHYPAQIKGTKGDLQLTMVIVPDGKVALVGLHRSSGSYLLDQAAVRLIHLAAPFEPFPKELRAETDMLAVTRTFTFTNKNDKSSPEDAPLWRPLSVQ